VARGSPAVAIDGLDQIRSFQLSYSSLSACWIMASPLADISFHCAAEFASSYCSCVISSPGGESHVTSLTSRPKAALRIKTAKNRRE